MTVHLASDSSSVVHIAGDEARLGNLLPECCLLTCEMPCDCRSRTTRLWFCNRGSSMLCETDTIGGHDVLLPCHPAPVEGLSRPCPRGSEFHRFEGSSRPESGTPPARIYSQDR